MSASPASTDFVDVPCPFCGLVCDDLVVGSAGGQLTVRANGCAIAATGFGRPAEHPRPRLAGRPSAADEAMSEAARLLARAHQPLIAGLATDVAGARASLQLAERCGAILDHMNSAATIRNLLVLQDGGWITTTLSEVRNRCDLLIAAGGDIVGRFPRFFERVIANRETLFSTDRRCEVVFLGRSRPEGVEFPGPVTVVECDTRRLGEAFGALRALLAGRELQADAAALSAWAKLAERMRSARYGVLAWAAADFDFPHAELALQSLCELVKDLNHETRFSGLPLGGTDGDLTADSVLLWQTGYGARTSFARSEPRHDPGQLSATHLLERGEVDALLWISSFSATRTPPSTAVPTIVLGRPGMTFEREPAVFIPVGTPGLDHAGHLFRTDRVVALPVRQLRPATLPSVAEAIAGIEARL
jgi:formylmethanofuran dehydrogenase subunit B